MTKINLFDARQNYVAMLLMLLLAMCGTRLGHALPGLPADASWAIFLLAGYYLRQLHAFNLLLATAVAIDLVVIGLGLTEGVCVNWGYLALLPAYGALFYGGVRCSEGIPSLRYYMRAALLAILAISAGFVISNAGFYLGGLIENNSATLVSFAGGVLPYYAVFLKSSLFYAGLGVLMLDSVALFIQKAGKSSLRIRRSQ
jgi:hypothetical protein